MYLGKPDLLVGNSSEINPEEEEERKTFL